MNDYYQPYTYLIGWKNQNIWYYGCEYKNDINGRGVANPINLWDTYFTSSEIVKEFRFWHGEPDVIRVRKVFKTAEKTRECEYRCLKKVGAVKSKKWLNQHNANEEWGNYGPMHEDHKEKISKAIKEYIKTNEHCINISKSLTGRKIGPFSQKHKSNMSKSMLGKKKGPMSEDHKKKISRSCKEWWDNHNAS